MSGAVLRFAPSPNGRLHLGHAYSALLNEAEARRLGGRCLLRIEDIDPVRCRPGYVAGILEDLAWLGLRYGEPIRRQSQHMDDYRHAFAELRARRLVYPCLCSRGEIARTAASLHGDAPPRDPDGAIVYPGACRDRPRADVETLIRAGLAPAWRLDTAAALAALGRAPAWTACDPACGERQVLSDPERWGDPVVVRRDVPTSYHLAVVVDDAAQGVTHVVRGQDLEAATDIHVLLQALLGLPSPHYHHHRLIRDASGVKLGKRLGSQPLSELRAGGTAPAEIRRALGFDR